MVCCFYERKPTSIGKLFGRRAVTHYTVEQSSACLDPSCPSTQNFSLCRNQFDMNIFADPEGDDFLLVKEMFKYMVNQALRLVQHLSRTVSEQRLGTSAFNLTLRWEEGIGKEGIVAGTPLLFQLGNPKSSTGGFIDRTDALNDLQSRLLKDNFRSQKRFVITGIGGRGKGKICLKIIDTRSNQFTIIACINVSTIVGAEKPLINLVGNRGLHASDLNNARNALASILGDYLNVLYNADEPNEEYQGFAPPTKR